MVFNLPPGVAADWAPLAAALGIGLLIGAERERRKPEGPARSPAGIRTFAVAALVGPCGLLAGGALLLGVALAAVAGLAALGYWRNRDDDPGLTTEVALVLTVLLGALCVDRPALAAALAVATTVLLAARAPLHRFARNLLTADEARDALTLASATLVVLPLLPSQALGPYAALNPRAIWIVVVLIMTIGAVGQVVGRLVGVRYGLPLLGLASGFVSSTATIGAMGARARKAPDQLDACVAAAVLSTLATVAQMALVVGAVSSSALGRLVAPLALAGAVAGVYAVVFAARAIRAPAEAPARIGRAFNLKGALGFGVLVAAISLATAALRAWMGEEGVLAAAALAGVVDPHAAAASVAALVAGGKLTPEAALVPILAGLTANSVSKLGLAVFAGPPGFAVRVAPGLILVALAAWVGFAVDAGGWVPL